MKRENNPASIFIHFANATVLKTSIVAVVDIPASHPGQVSRRRIVTTGNFPIDVPESMEEVLMRWKGDSGVEEARAQSRERRIAELEEKLRVIHTCATAYEVPKSLDAAELLGRMDRIRKELE